MKQKIFDQVSKVMPEVSNAFNKAKDAIQTNVTQIVNNLSGGKPTLGRVKVGNRELEEVRLINQGGYAYVFEVKDVETGEIFALKKMICQSTERLRTAKNEIKILQSLPDHPNLLKLYDSELVKVSDGHHAYILMEYCDGGSIYDLMVKYESTKLSERQIIFVMREACEGVRALHSCDPPIVHRDLKIENILIHNKKFKLCDFGSCSSRFVDFSKISQKEYAFYEEEYDKNTTLMYRPPEMCDPYMKYVVNEKVDVWMLGCILYTMCFYKSPFQEASKLAVVNGSYTFPKDNPYPEKLIDIIRIMLTPNPQNRPSIFELSDIFGDYFNIESIQLNEEAQRIKEESLKKEHEYKQEKKPKHHNDDIPIEELMKIQKKVQNKIQKSKKNEPQFVEWGQAKYPGQKPSDSAQESDDWGAFHSSDTQVSGNMFETFGQFNENNQQQQQNAGGNGTWDAFDFGAGTKAAEEQTANNNDWNPNLWETPQFAAGEKEQKADANNFDFFGDFSSTTASEKKEETKPEIHDDLI